MRIAGNPLGFGDGQDDKGQIAGSTQPHRADALQIACLRHGQCMLYHHIPNGDPLMLKGRHFMAALVLSALVATLPHPQPSEASGRWPGQMPYPRSEPGVEALQRKIAEADRAAERMGYFPIGVERSSTIRPPRQTETVSVLLGSGRYMIMGQCDTDCADMDLEARDLSTGEIIPEEKPRGYPIVLLQLRE